MMNFLPATIDELDPSTLDQLLLAVQYNNFLDIVIISTILGVCFLVFLFKFLRIFIF